MVLDGIERVAEPLGFRIGSHDLHESLPEVVVSDTGNRYRALSYRVLRGPVAALSSGVAGPASFRSLDAWPIVEVRARLLAALLPAPITRAGRAPPVHVHP